MISKCYAYLVKGITILDKFEKFQLNLMADFLSRTFFFFYLNNMIMKWERKG